MKGWETRSGSEVTITPYFNYCGTKYKFGEFSQTATPQAGPSITVAYDFLK